MPDGGESIAGSFLLADVPSREEAEKFNRDDPFNRAGIWETVRIHRLNKRWDDQG